MFVMYWGYGADVELLAAGFVTTVAPAEVDGLFEDDVLLPICDNDEDNTLL